MKEKTLVQRLGSAVKLGATCGYGSGLAEKAFHNVPLTDGDLYLHAGLVTLVLGATYLAASYAVDKLEGKCAARRVPAPQKVYTNWDSRRRCGE